MLSYVNHDFAGLIALQPSIPVLCPKQPCFCISYGQAGGFAAVELPPETETWLFAVAGFVHRVGVVKAAVNHHVLYFFAVMDVFQRVGRHHHQIGELADFQ